MRAWIESRTGRLGAWFRRWGGMLCGLGVAASVWGQVPGGRPPVVVYAPTPCLSCIDWADHLRQKGFDVTLNDVPQADMPKLKRRFQVPEAVESVQTARIGPYFLEGPVPAEDVIELLRERPRARGLAVPGTPRGAPGLEAYNPVCDTACAILDNAEREPDVRREVFQTLLVAPDGRTRIWARH